MFNFKLLVLAVLITAVLCGGEDYKSDKKKEKYEKIKKCMKETKDLKDCCPSNTDDESMKDDPECKHHLEGIETMDKKAKGKAYKCFTECIFTTRGIYNDGVFEKDKLKEFSEKAMVKSNDIDLKDIAFESIDYCMGELEDMKWNQWGAAWKNKMENDSDNNDEKQCSFQPLILVGCISGNIVRNCPESKWTGTEECEALKSNVTSMEDCMTF